MCQVCINATRPDPLVCFAFQSHEDGHGHYWIRLVTVRRDSLGNLVTRFNELDWEFARRIAPAFAVRAGVPQDDLAGLFSGRIFSIAG